MATTTQSDASRSLVGPKLALIGAASSLDLAAHLIQAQAQVLDAEPPPQTASDALAARFGYRRLSVRTGDVGALKAILQIVKTAVSGKPPKNWIWRRKDGRFVDGLRPDVDPDGVADETELIYLREAHHKALIDVVRTADVVTLLLTPQACFVDTADGAAYGRAPSGGVRTQAGFAPKSHVPDLKEMDEDFRAVRQALLALNPKLRLQVVMMPQPARLGDDVDFDTQLPLLRQQSDLRVMMAHWAASWPEVDYVPLWELCTGKLMREGHYAASTGTLTAIGGALVAALIMGQEAMSVGPAALTTGPNGQSKEAVAKRKARRAQKRADRAAQGRSSQKIICEDELLEAFSK